MCHLSTALLFIVAMSQLCLGQTCDKVFINKRIKRPLIQNFQDHRQIGLTRECLESKVPVEQNSMRCFKWRVNSRGDVELTNRRQFSSEGLVSTAGNSVTLRSPGYYNNGPKYYRNSMFCVYNISLTDCAHITVRSTANQHSLFFRANQTNDYLYLEFSPSYSFSLTGDNVGSFSAEVSTKSFYAVLMSDAERDTSRGRFELTTMCADQYINEENTDGSGTITTNS